MRTLWLLVVVGCSTTAPGAAGDYVQPMACQKALKRDVVAPRARSQVHWLAHIGDEEAWRQLAAPSDEHAVARCEVVKVLWDHSSDRMYFMESRSWPLHYEFAARFLASGDRPIGDRKTFNTRQYLRPDRTMQMASLVHYLDAGLWVLELGPADNLSPEGLMSLFERLRPLVFFGEALQYRPRSELHMRVARQTEGRIGVIIPSSVWAGARYQPVTLGTAVGRLRIVERGFDPAGVVPDEILVLGHTPDDFPLCAGLITTQLQAPLSHLAVLSQSRRTPNLATRDMARLRAFDGRIVRLEVRPDDFSLLPASVDELEESLRASRPRPLGAPAIDGSRPDFAATCTLRIVDTSWAGAKAAQLGEVCAAGVPTSAGFVVPIHHFQAHLRDNLIDASVAGLRSVPGFDDQGRVRARALGALRRRVRGAPVAGAVLMAIRRRLSGHRRRRWIFRSSSNAEDLPGFSGAGLYDSVVVGPNATDLELENAVRTVWASLWNRRAWDEREYYGLDHGAVGMAVLVQPFVDDVVATGVAITMNPFSSRRRGMFLNLAPAGPKGGTPEAGALPEQVLLYRNSRAEIVSRATPGKSLVTERALGRLQDRLQRVHHRMVAIWNDGRADAVDVELAIRRDGSAIILQARPYRHVTVSRSMAPKDRGQ